MNLSGQEALRDPVRQTRKRTLDTKYCFNFSKAKLKPIIDCLDWCLDGSSLFYSLQTRSEINYFYGAASGWFIVLTPSSFKSQINDLIVGE